MEPKWERNANMKWNGMVSKTQVKRNAKERNGTD